VTSRVPTAGAGRVLERRRAVALARHFRDAEGLSIAQIADRLGRSPATIKAYFYDPTGAKARAVKARYVGVCRGCGTYTQPRNGKGDAYAYCKRCHPGAIERRWTQERVVEAMLTWRSRYGRLPSSYDWVAHARAPAWGTGARPTGPRRMAGCERGRQAVWDVGCRAGGGCVRRGRGRCADGRPGRPGVGRADWAHRRFVCPIARNRPQNPSIRGRHQVDVILSISRLFTAASAGPRVIRVGEVPGSNPGAPTQKTPQSAGFFVGRMRFPLGSEWAARLNPRNCTGRLAGQKLPVCRYIPSRRPHRQCR
jgi:hypothetical protein